MLYHNITELIGNTPIVMLNSLPRRSNLKANIYVKLEYYNPGGSSKDRAAFNMIKQAMVDGKINSNTVIVEGTSGNTGIGLSHVAAAMGLKLILVIPDSMSKDKINHIKAMGAQVVLTPGVFGMKKAFMEANKIAEEIGNSYVPNQIMNEANPQAHELSTGPEIWEDMDGKIDIFVAGIGTGGTITGTGRYLKKMNSDIKVIGVEPYGSSVITGYKRGPHKIQGIGAGFIPDNLDLKVLDEVVRIKDDDALSCARDLATEEGIFTGISSGAATWAAIYLAKRPENKGKNIVAFLPDTGERYLSTELYDRSIKDCFVN